MESDGGEHGPLTAEELVLLFPAVGRILTGLLGLPKRDRHRHLLRPACRIFGPLGKKGKKTKGKGNDRRETRHEQDHRRWMDGTGRGDMIGRIGTVLAGGTEVMALVLEMLE